MCFNAGEDAMMQGDVASGPRRRVLMLAYQFPPNTGSVQRVTRYVKYLPEFGWDVVVVTRKVDPHDPADSSLLPMMEERAKIVRAGGTPLWLRLHRRLALGQATAGQEAATPGVAASSARRSGAKAVVKKWLRAVRLWTLWPDPGVGWVPSAFIAGLHQIMTGKVDAIYTNSPPPSTHLAGLALKLLTGIHWVADFRDPWANDPDISMPTAAHRLAHNWAERLVLRNADEIATTTDFHTDYIRNRVGAERAGRAHTITNGFDGEEMQGLPTFAGEQFEILYAGGFGYSRRITPLLMALKQLRTHSPEIAAQVKVRIIGAPNPPVIAEVEEAGLRDCVSFTDQLPHRCALEEMAKSALLLLVVHSDEYIAQISVPAKLFEYMATGRPILAITPPGAAANLVKETGSGMVLHPDDIDGIERAIAEYYEKFTRNELGTYHNPEVLERFERRNLTAAFSRLLEPGPRGSANRPVYEGRAQNTSELRRP